ncbi:MAG TPA: hypothetical protein VFH63_02925 [candidate division Zixibacteria bacterium]|nr:hypothetical protein [candidate division Zixibacteria bacterium]
MYRPPRTRVAAAVLCAALLLAACGGSPGSGSAAPGAPTDTDQTPAASSAPAGPSASAQAPSGQIDIGELTDSVSQLDSYQMDITLVDAAEGEQTLTVMATANPKASHYRMGDELELITIEGQGAWIMEGGEWVDATGSEQMFVALFDALAPDTVVAGYGLDRYADVFRPQGTESKNGVQATHYHLDAQDVAQLEGGEDFPADGVFDLWIAEDGGYLVAMVFSGTDPETGAALEFRMDVSRVNDPSLVIAPPV